MTAGHSKPLYVLFPCPSRVKYRSLFSNLRNLKLYERKLLDKNINCIKELIQILGGDAQNYTKQDGTRSLWLRAWNCLCQHSKRPNNTLISLAVTAKQMPFLSP
jgi:hypothetical protein